jgi:DNA-damage-inducible protein D
VDKARLACANSGQVVEDHFVQTHDMVQVGSGARRKVEDYHLSRYTCYLVIQNADPSKEIVALGQTYFLQCLKVNFWRILKGVASAATLFIIIWYC